MRLGDQAYKKLRMDLEIDVCYEVGIGEHTSVISGAALSSPMVNSMPLSIINFV